MNPLGIVSSARSRCMRAERRAAVVLVPLVILTTSCGEDGGTGPLQQMTSVLLKLGPGITVVPSPQHQLFVDADGFVTYESQFAKGSTVSYQLLAQDGRAHVLVTLDGADAPTTVSLTMDEDHAVNALINTSVGAPMPDFVGQDADGHSIGLSGLLGKVVYVDFGEMTCPGSITGAPILAALYATYHPRGLEVVTMLVYGPTTNVSSTAADLLTWQSTYSLPFPVVRDPAKATKIFNRNPATGSTDFPTGYLVDAAGIIRYRFAGWDGAGLSAALAVMFP